MGDLKLPNRSSTDFDKCTSALSEAGIASDISIKKIAKNLSERVEYHKEKLRKSGSNYSEEAINKEAHEKAVKDLQGSMVQERLDEVNNTRIRLDIADEIKKGTSVKSATRIVANRIQQTERAANGILGEIVNNSMQDFFNKFQSLPLGVDIMFKDNVAMLKQVVKGVYNDPDTHTMAKGFADSLKKTQDWFFKAFEEYGITMPKLDNYVAPMKYSYRKVAKLGQSGFVDLMSKHVSLDDYNRVTGKDYSPQEFKEELMRVYNDMLETMNGTDGAVGYTRSNGEKLGDAIKRKFYFKTSEDWLAVHEAIGSGNIYSNIIEDMMNNAEQLAQLRYWGPDSDANFQYARGVAKTDMKKRKAEGRGVKKLEDPFTPLDWQWKQMTGRSNSVVNKYLADFMSAVKNIVGSSLLGRAVLNSLSDQANVKMMTEITGMSYKRYLGNLPKFLMNVNNKTETQRFMVRTATSLENLGTYAKNVGRYGEVGNVGKMSKVTAAIQDFVLRSTGLIQWTKGQRDNFQYMLSAEIADLEGLPYQKLPDHWKSLFEEFGIDQTDWQHIHASIKDVPTHIDGLSDHYIDPGVLKEKNIDTFIKYSSMQSELGRRAVLEPSVEVQSAFSMGEQRGTWKRELLSPVMHLKSFAITQTLASLRTVLFDPRVTNRISFASRFAAYTTLLGGLSVVATELAKGHDAPNVFTKEFFGQALLKGAALGIAADAANVAKYTSLWGSSKQTTANLMMGLLGPTYPFLMEPAALVLRAKKDPVEAYYDALIWAGKYSPGSNMWYKQQLDYNSFIDILKEMADPTRKKREDAAKKKFDRHISNKSK